LSTLDLSNEFIIQFHDFTKRTLQEEIKSLLNQMIWFTFNEVLTKRTQISKHDGVRLLLYNDVLAYVGHPMMPVSLNGQIKDVWENVYKCGEQRRV
jgi:hypothetical protein